MGWSGVVVDLVGGGGGKAGKARDFVTGERRRYGDFAYLCRESGTEGAVMFHYNEKGENVMREYEVCGFKVREYEELDSTNTEAARLPMEELEDRMVILTRRQHAGRGQVGNRWESEPGRNLSLTLVLRPENLPAAEQFAVSMAVALGTRDFVARHVEGCSVKWPNDIYVGERKISGILIEHTILGDRVGLSLCGVGVNVNQRRFVSDAPNPVSLWQLTGRELPLDEALGELLACVDGWYRRVGEYAALEREFLRRLYRREGVYWWESDAGERFEAAVRGVDEYGRLVLADTAGVERVYGFKEVRYL